MASPDRRPRLTHSGISALAYHHDRFERDLAAIIRGSEVQHVRLSVSSFCPDYPEVAMYSEPAHVFRQLEDSAWFLCSFFASQLFDQAAHTLLRRGLRSRAGTNGEIVLVGLLGSYYSKLSPAFLLLVASLYEAPFAHGTFDDAWRDVTTAEFSSHGEAYGVLQMIRHEAATALSEHAMPDSLRAFLPYGDDYPWQPDFRRTERARRFALDGLSAAV